MDPRHPEIAVDRIDQLVNQFKRNLDNIRTATVSSQLAQLEREGGLVVQEICLVAPRLHEAMMQASRQRRHDLARGAAFGYKPEERVGKYIKATIAIEEKPVEKLKDDAEFKKVIDDSMEVVEKAKDIVEKALKDTKKKKTSKKKKAE